MFYEEKSYPSYNIFKEVSKLTERITELKSQLINVKDEQDFNINQLIKHRNDLKLKMDKIKEDMENGLVDDKEKLKYLVLMGSQMFKVCKHHLHFIFFSTLIFFSETAKSFKKR